MHCLHEKQKLLQMNDHSNEKKTFFALNSFKKFDFLKKTDNKSRGGCEFQTKDLVKPIYT